MSLQLNGGVAYRLLVAGSEATQDVQRLESLLPESEITQEGDLERACEHLFHTPVDLVVLSGHDNRELLAVLRFSKATRPMVPVIVLTSQGSEAFAVSAFRAGAWDYFRKPFATEEFNGSVRAALGARQPFRHDQLSVNHQGLARALTYASQHFNCAVRLKEIAREAGMSVSRFARTFKDATGTTFVNYLNQLRVARAKELLRSEGLSIMDVAFACGFRNPFHFSRTFKKITGASPTGFRRIENGRH